MDKSIKSIRWVLAIGILALTVPSCLVTKKYTAPETSGAHLFRLDSLSQQGESINSIQWKAFFQDPILQGYIDSALVNNADNRIALKNIEAFQARFSESKAKHYPSVSVEGSVMTQQQSTNTQFGSFVDGELRTYTATAKLSWEADLWGKINSQRLAARAQFEQSITAQKLLQTQLIANIANAYYKLLEADVKQKVLNDSKTVREQSVHVLEQLKNAGQTNALAVYRAKAQVAEIERLIVANEQQIFVLENALTLLIGSPMPIANRGKLAEQQFPAVIAPSLPADILANRPDVKVAELAFRQQFELHNAAKASMYPTIRLTADAGYQSIELADWFDPNSFIRTITGGLTQPLFQGKQLRTQKKLADIEKDKSFITFRNTVLKASLEVSNLLKDMKTQQQTLKAVQEQEALLDESFQTSKTLLQQGFANYLDVLTAQEALLNTQLEHNRIKSLQLQTTAMTYRALGGGAR